MNKCNSITATMRCPSENSNFSMLRVKLLKRLWRKYIPEHIEVLYVTKMSCGGSKISQSQYEHVNSWRIARIQESGPFLENYILTRGGGGLYSSFVGKSAPCSLCTENCFCLNVNNCDCPQNQEQC